MDLADSIRASTFDEQPKLLTGSFWCLGTIAHCALTTRYLLLKLWAKGQEPGVDVAGWQPRGASVGAQVMEDATNHKAELRFQGA